MEQYDEDTAANREHAGQMLAQKLVTMRFNDGVVVGMQPGGLAVASVIADRLHFPLEMVPSRVIKNPADETKTIGAVSIDEVYYHDCPYSMPQDYFYFQMVRLRNEIRYDNEFYYGHHKEHDFAGKTIILTHDLLTSPDALMVTIMSIRKQRPAKIIVAIPFVQAEAARIVQSACDEFVFIKMKQRVNSPTEFYGEFLTVDEWDARSALWHSNAELVEAG